MAVPLRQLLTAAQREKQDDWVIDVLRQRCNEAAALSALAAQLERYSPAGYLSVTGGAGQEGLRAVLLELADAGRLDVGGGDDPWVGEGPMSHATPPGSYRHWCGCANPVPHWRTHCLEAATAEEVFGAVAPPPDAVTAGATRYASFHESVLAELRRACAASRRRGAVRDRDQLLAAARAAGGLPHCGICGRQEGGADARFCVDCGAQLAGPRLLRADLDALQLCGYRPPA
eukprot:TRINITY_DN15055_c0_g1_i1.p1 TRINITY_DN15055_c0_g1~~TRINITY_DN15055_c0_g1_i1.p1  ORF type:complete len:231 (+),score=70.69 TRINITY_DN15055_c0_g1_i1:54-746(+)